MRSLSELLPLLFVALFAMLVRRAQRSASRGQAKKRPAVPQPAVKSVAGKPVSMKPPVLPASASETVSDTREERRWDGSGVDTDNSRSSREPALSTDAPSSQPKESSVRTQQEAAILPAFSRDVLVQAVVLSQVLGPPGGRCASHTR